MITNSYSVSGSDTRAVHLEVFRHGEYVTHFRVDSELVLTLREHSWTVRKSDGYGACTKCGVLLHRFVMSANSGSVVDHINHQPHDNVRSNLRIGTHQQNMTNRKPNTGNVLPVAGVYHTSNGKWRVEKEDGGVRRSLGSYDHVYDACLARAKWELESRRDWAATHRRWIYKLPMEFKLSWFPEIYGPDSMRFWRSPLHLVFFADKFRMGKAKEVNHKLRRYQHDYAVWKRQNRATIDV